MSKNEKQHKDQVLIYNSDNIQSTKPTYPNHINPEVPESHDKRGSIRNLADSLHHNEYIRAHVVEQVVNVNRPPTKRLNHID